MQIRIELLGKMRITVSQNLLMSVNTNRMRSLLAYLVLHGDEAQSREHLAFLLWPESGEAQARTNLRQVLHNLRRALPVECSLLVTDNQAVRWRADSSCAIDVVEFEAAVRAVEAAKESDVTTVREALEAAARLYQDDLLPDLYDDWLEARRGQLRQQFAEVLSQLVALLEMAGEYPAGIRHASRLIALDPLRESYYQVLMRLHIGNNDRSSALRVYHQCLRNLQRDLGVSPGKAIQNLFMQALKSGEMSGAPAALPPYTATKPLELVGRKMEWERLLGCWQNAKEGEGHFALIMGEPGIGKSRLAGELFEACSRLSHHKVARARCFFAQGQLAYGPVAELLRAEPMRLARAQLPLPQLAELTRVLPEILVEHSEIAPPQPLTESWQRLHLYEAINATFRKAPKPLLLLIDDLQWCDHDSFDWMHSLFRSGAADRILVVGTVRMEETGRDHPLANLVRELRISGQLSEFSIAPLSVDETASLAAQIAKRKLDPSFLAGLYPATKGNPLFVVESVRASLEYQDSDGSVPPRVQAVIAARFAQLSSSAYELAGITATIGRPFSFDLLAKATDWDEDSLSRALEELWQRRIIDGQGADVYDYTHDLLRDVAYAELSPIRKRSMHRRVARALEEHYASDYTGISGRLAAHYEAAGMAEQAIRFYGIAASVAKQRFADTESADLIRRALRLCRDFPESAKRDQEELELLAMLGPSLVTTHGYSMPEVGETYQRGLKLSARSGDQKHLFALRSGAWLFHIVRGELEESRRLGQDCVDSARHEDVPAQQIAGHFLLGTSLFHLGQLEASWNHIEMATQSSDEPSHPALALFAGPDLGVFYRAYGSHLLCQLCHSDDAAKKSDESIARARDVSHPFTLGIALNYAAMMNVYRMESKLALARAEEASSICRKHGFAYYLALAEIFAGWAIAVEGDPAAGLKQLRQGIDKFKATGAELRLPFYYGLLAEVHALAGQFGEALANIASGFAFLSKNRETWSGAELHRIHGDLLRHNGDTAQSQASYRRALESAKETGSRLYEDRASARLQELLEHHQNVVER
jgi:DNA-binding SARP family transcriptional activator/predicted ATPase